MAVALVLLVALPRARTGAQQSAPLRAAGDSAASHVLGRYDFAFTPPNGEPLTGRLTITRRQGHFSAVISSPKLQSPEVADSLSIADGHVTVTVLGGAYTFDFRVTGDRIADATFTKSMRGETERGPLSLNRVRP